MFKRPIAVVLSASIAIQILTAPVSAHEFWIDPVSYTPRLNAKVPIVFRIGSNFQGDTYPYVRALDRGFFLQDSRGSRKLQTADGDDPAAEAVFPSPGLAIVWHRRAPEPVVFETMAAFEDTLADEGLEEIGRTHRAAGKRLDKIREEFARCAKALLQVGESTAGADRAVGLPLEFVALTNPYARPAGEKTAIRVRLQHEGKPVSNALIKVFHRAGSTGPSALQRLRTDDAGTISVDVSQSGEYLLAAVQMTAREAKASVDYSSLWASLSFSLK